MIAWLLVAALGAEPVVLPASATDPASRALFTQLQKGLPEARVGQWVTYEIIGGPGRSAYWRLAIVGQQKDPKGRDAYWMEMELGEHPKFVAPLVQMKLLVAKAGGLGKAGNVTRFILAVGATQPQELDEKALAQTFPEAAAGIGQVDAAPAQKGLHVKTGQARKLMTEAGTVTALPVETLYRDTVLQRVWLSRDVPLFELAGLELPPIDHGLRLHDFGANATAQIRLPRPGVPRIGVEPSPGADVLRSETDGGLRP